MTPEQRAAARERHKRLRDHSVYRTPWTNAGGPKECKHGFAAGIPCFRCDEESALDDLPAALDALDAADSRIRELEAWAAKNEGLMEAQDKAIGALTARIDALVSERDEARDRARNFLADIRQFGEWLKERDKRIAELEAALKHS